MSRNFRPPVDSPTTYDERLVKELQRNSAGFNYPSYPVEILEKRCYRWAKANRLTPGAGHVAASFCKRARKQVLKSIAEGEQAEASMPTNFTPKERRLFDINSAFLGQLCEIVLDHIELSQKIEDLNKDFVLDDAPMNSLNRP